MLPPAESADPEKIPPALGCKKWSPPPDDQALPEKTLPTDDQVLLEKTLPTDDLAVQE